MTTKRDPLIQFPVSLTWWPVVVMAAAVDGYHSAFFACFPSWNWGKK